MYIEIRIRAALATMGRSDVNKVVSITSVNWHNSLILRNMIKTLKNKGKVIFLASLLLSSSSVFAISLFGKDSFIWKENTNVYVKYAGQDSFQFGANEHPVELAETDLRTILQSLRTQEDESKTVFTDRQSQILGKFFSQGLRNAKPDQDIVFALDREAPRPLGLKPNVFYLSGRTFYKDGRLNLMLGDYDFRRNVAYETTYDPTKVGIAKYYFNHGKRSASSGSFDKKIVSIEGIDKMQLNNSQRNDWLVIDVAAVSTTLSQLESNSHHPAELREDMVDTRRDNTTRAVIAPPTSQTTSSSAPHPVEQRLIVLKRLRDKGLITEEEYDKKRKVILDEL